MNFKISGNLLRFSNFRSDISVSASTVESGLQQLVADLPQLRPVLLDGEGRFRQVHRLFLNGDIVARGELSRDVSETDEVAILTAIAGG